MGVPPIPADEWQLLQTDAMDMVIFYPNGKRGELSVDPTISTTYAADSVTVSVTNEFEIQFDRLKGGIIDSWFDLQNDSGKTDQLANTTTGLFDFFTTASATDRRISGETGATQHVLEVTPTRIVLQYVGQLGNAASYDYILTYSIYATGDIYIKLQTTNNTGSTITWTAQRAEINIDSATNHNADGDNVASNSDAMVAGTDNWVKWVGDGSTKKDAAILYNYSGFNYVEYYTTGTAVAFERDTDETQDNTAKTTRIFKLQIFPDTGTMGTTETTVDIYSNSFRNPENIGGSISNGQGWFDSIENTDSSNSDYFNEAEGVYDVQTGKTISQNGWWHSDWGKRKQLSLINNSGQAFEANTTYQVTINTKELYDQGNVQADCDDLRMVYQPDLNTITQLNHHLMPAQGSSDCSTSTATIISFPLQASVGSSATDKTYYLYYGNSGAAALSAANTEDTYDVGAKAATLACPFNGTTTCAAGETASTATGAIRYSGSKSALSFDGANDKVAAGNVGGGIKTVEFWIKPNSASTPLLDLGGGAIATVSAGTVSTSGITGANIFVNGAATSTLTANTWSHLAITATTAINALAVNLGLASNSYFTGVMDEVRLSNVIRYPSAFTVPTSPFIRDEYTKLLYHFDENGDDPRNTGKVIDDSGNANHGTITGAKYVSGLVGVDSSTTDTGYMSNQSYAGHQGVFIEEVTTNKITNPSFENSTYDTNWSASQIFTDGYGGDVNTARDTFLDQAYQPGTYGNYNRFALNYGQNSPILISFDLSSIPASATCNSASMSLFANLQDTYYATHYVYELASANANWTETTIQEPATNGGPTYDFKSQTAQGVGTAWAGSEGARTAGTDYINSALGNWTEAGEAVGNEYEIALTSSAIEAWFGTTNNGLIIHHEGGAIQYASSDHATTGYRPKLVVDYSDPAVVTKNTTAPYYKFGSSSTKATLTSSTDLNYFTSINAGNTNSHTLSAYVYRGTAGSVGGTVDNTVAQLYWQGVAQSGTAYTDMGGGWWRLSYTNTGTADAQNYGVTVVEDSGTVYIDGVQLEEKAYATTYADGSLTSSAGGNDTYFWDDDCDGTLDAGEDQVADQNAQCSSRLVENLQYATSSNITAATGSLSTWFKPQTTIASISGDQYLFDIRSDASNQIALYLDASTDDITLNTNGTETSSVGVTLNTGTWNNLILTYNFTTDNYNVYLNGNATPIIATTTALTAPSLPTDFVIGGDYNNANKYNGVISSFISYDAVLTTAEII